VVVAAFGGPRNEILAMEKADSGRIMDASFIHNECTSHKIDQTALFSLSPIMIVTLG
jgi:hypothetical protein